MLAVACFALVLQAPPRTDPAFQGAWVGTLTYRDYSNDARESLGTLLRVYKPKGSNGWVFRYVYDDGPTKVVQDSDLVKVDWPNHKYTVASQDGKETDSYDIDDHLIPDGTGTLILNGKGTENSAVVDIRQTFTISKDHLDILRESRLPGQPFKFRHEYSFQRVKE